MLFPIRENERYGYMTEEGKVEVSPAFHYASSFASGIAFVETLKRDFDLYDLAWRKLGTVDSRVEPDSGFSFGIQRVREKSTGDLGFGDQFGKLVVFPRFFDARVFDHHGGAFASTIDDANMPLWGRINRDGDWTSSPRFADVIKFFSDGNYTVARVADAQHWQIIDQDCNVCTPGEFLFAAPQSEGLIIVRLDGAFGWLDSSFKVVGKCRVNSIGNRFTDGQVPAEVDGKWGVINDTGRWIIQPNYHFIASKSGVYWPVQNDKGLYGLIDTSGELVYDYSFALPPYFVDGITKVTFSPRDDGHHPFGYLNSKLELIWREDWLTE